MHKIMKVHAQHEDENKLSRKSSGAFLESVNYNNHNSHQNCKCCMVSSGTVSHQQSSERNLNFDTPKVSISDNDCLQVSRNYEVQRKIESSSRKTSDCGFSNPEEMKNHRINSQARFSPKSISEISKISRRPQGCRTQKPSFIENKADLCSKEPTQMISKEGYNREYLMPVIENPRPMKDKPGSKLMFSNKTTAYHTSTSSMNKNGKIYFESSDLYAHEPK